MASSDSFSLQAILPVVNVGLSNVSFYLFSFSLVCRLVAYQRFEDVKPVDEEVSIDETDILLLSCAYALSSMAPTSRSELTKLRH